MKKRYGKLISLILILSLFSCGKKEEKWKSKISEATSVEVGIMNKDPFLNQVIRLKDKEEIEIMKRLISEEETEAFKCEYSGSVNYRIDTVLLLAVEFNFDPACTHVSFIFEGKNYYRKMTPEGESFLKNLVRRATEPALAGLNWVLGNWERNEGDSISTEWWKKKDEKNFDGGSFTIHLKDTIFSEQLKIAESDSGIHYYATVSENSGPIGFKLTRFGFHRAVFENPRHDWPQKISYSMDGENELLARVEGPMGERNYYKDFRMKKKILVQ